MPIFFTAVKRINMHIWLDPPCRHCMYATAEQRPGPAEYSVAATSTDTPEYSCRENCLPIYPDILLYPEYREFICNTHYRTTVFATL